MALTEVGLNYVSDNADEFIRNAKDATKSVNDFNRSLRDTVSLRDFMSSAGNSSGLNKFNNNIGRSTSLIEGFTEQAKKGNGSMLLHYV